LRRLSTEEGFNHILDDFDVHTFISSLKNKEGEVDKPKPGTCNDQLVKNVADILVIVSEQPQTNSPSTTTCNSTSVKDMAEDAKGKVRYCGAWAISKERKKCRDYFRTNIYSSDGNVRKSAKVAYLKKELLDQLVWTSVVAQQESKYQDTLNVTLARKYDKGNLVHVPDDMYEWTLELEQERVNFLNHQSFFFLTLT